MVPFSCTVTFDLRDRIVIPAATLIMTGEEKGRQEVRWAGAHGDFNSDMDKTSSSLFYLFVLNLSFLGSLTKRRRIDKFGRIWHGFIQKVFGMHYSSRRLAFSLPVDAETVMRYDRVSGEEQMKLLLGWCMNTLMRGTRRRKNSHMNNTGFVWGTREKKVVAITLIRAIMLLRVRSNGPSDER